MWRGNLARFPRHRRNYRSVLIQTPPINLFPNQLHITPTLHVH